MRDDMKQFLTDLTDEDAAHLSGGHRGRGSDDQHRDDHGHHGRRRRRRGSDDGPNHT